MDAEEKQIYAICYGVAMHGLIAATIIKDKRDVLLMQEKALMIADVMNDYITEMIPK